MKLILRLFVLLLVAQSASNFAQVYHQHRTYDEVGYCRYCDNALQYDNQSTIRWNDDFANEWPRYGVTNEGKVGFSDISEQPLISGFERSVYNTPK
ncbi:hypothetical protein BH09DEP1_BH09DEP1_1400 [soil metagenome]